MDHQPLTSGRFPTTTAIRRRLSAVSVAVFTTAAVLMAPGVANAADGCTTTKGASTSAVYHHKGRSIELRVNKSNGLACAWGRIFGSKGDRVWTDRAASHKAAREGRWEGPLGARKINSGGSNFSDPHAHKGKVMRACGSVSNFPHDAFCTVWW